MRKGFPAFVTFVELSIKRPFIIFIYFSEFIIYNLFFIVTKVTKGQKPMSPEKSTVLAVTAMKLPK